MDGLFDGLASLGASLAQALLGGAAFAFAAWAGMQVGKRKGELAGWLSAIAIFMMLAALLSRSLDVLDGVRCGGSADYDNCLSGSGPEEWP